MKPFRWMLLGSTLLCLLLFSACQSCRHQYESVVTPPTTGEGGYTTHTCKICGNSYTDAATPPKYSSGLSYRVNPDQKTCTITGMGTCRDADVRIPPKINNHWVTAIGGKAFSGVSEMTSIQIPTTVNSIGTRAFFGCTGLTEFTIPSSVKDIGSHLFQNATHLTTVYYDSNVSSEGFPFASGNVTKVVFTGKGIPANVCRDAVSLKEVVIPEGISHIGTAAFKGCENLVSVSLPSTLTSIAGAAFQDCAALAAVTLPDSVSSVGWFAFDGCKSLTAVTLPKSLTFLGGGVFRNCKALSSVSLPIGVVSLLNHSFDGCTKLTSLSYQGSKAQWEKIKKEDSWNSDTGNYTVQCGDGNLSK